ncbi:MAG: alpha-galactosidase [Clostridia bacterium]|nr:alpha-galactosidase [Clostridia bacterium]
MLYRFKTIFCLLQALLLFVSSLSVYDSDFKLKTDRAAMALTGVTEISFDPITAEETKVTDAEKQRCRAWFDANIRTADAPAYDFTVGGKRLRAHLSDWNISVGEESAVGEKFRGGKTTLVTLSHKKSALTATVEATIYEDFATCEWTVYIKNAGEENSPVVRDFYAADCALGTGLSDVYFSKGTDPAADDFELMKSAVCLTPMKFNANGGRSASWLPYFNVCGEDFGVVTAVGWTGQWFTSLRQTAKGVALRAKQEFFNGYLTAGETVRSPLVSLTFYEGKNALKGFNVFRAWETACVYTESAFPLTTVGLANEFDRRGTEEYIAQINSFSDEACAEADFLWRDAGWYPIKNDWADSVGTWRPDPERFPDGFAPIAEAAEARGLKLLLWFEPERCCEGTEVYEECRKHEGWLIEDGDPNRNMVNLANDDACAYLGDLIADAIRENKVGLYRQDFNFDVLELWRKADKTLYGGRTGIEENHYVTNLYKYLDTLLEVNPGLIIDNCASGGKRLDLEMSRRSIPLWRSDYNCMSAEGTLPDDVIEATQSATCGLSFWLPLYGTGIGGEGEYRYRSAIVPCAQTVLGYRFVRGAMTKNYYPLICGARDLDKYLAMQYGDGDSGAALIYKREKVASDICHITLNGLDPAREYEVFDDDCHENVTVKTGEALMTGGIDLPITETPKAVVLIYRVIG